MSKERTLHFFKDDHSPKINSSTQEDRCSDLDLIQKPYSCKFVELYEATNSRQLHAGLGSLRLVGESAQTQRQCAVLLHSPSPPHGPGCGSVGLQDSSSPAEGLTPNPCPLPTHSYTLT